MKSIKWILFALLCVLLVSTVLFLTHNTITPESAVNIKGKSTPVRHVQFETDGVLTLDWVNDAITIEKESGLLAIDHFAIKAKLEANEQIKSVSISKLFPDTLRIVLKERKPILRARVASKGNDQPVDFLVARDGIVYQGNNYLPFQLQSLPFLETNDLRRSGDRMKPVAGMEVVASLLGYARLYLPNVYHSWHVISCKKFNGDAEAFGGYILARGEWIDEIVFAPLDFERQFLSLAKILQYYSKNNIQQIKRIDLSLPQPVIRFHTDS